MSEEKEVQKSAHENKIFEKDDLLGLEPFAKSLYEHSIAESEQTNESLVIALNGKFGSGKSWFLEMFANFLEEKGNSVISLNAWETDFFDNPIIPIFSEFYTFLNDCSKTNNELKEVLLSGLSGLGVIANAIAKACLQGLDIAETIKEVKNGQELELKYGEFIYKEYIKTKDLYKSLESSLTEYVREQNNPVFILIDELDRTRPDYAIKFLECIKHLFQVKGIVFILAIDREHLQASVSHLYGADIKCEGYFRKFIHRNVSLPSLEPENIKKYVNEKTKEFFSEENRFGRKYAAEINFDGEERISELCMLFQLDFRAVNEMFRLLSHYLWTENGKSGKEQYVWAAIIYLAMSMYDNKYVTDINKIKYQEFFDVFEKLDATDNRKIWWYIQLLNIVSNKSDYQNNFKFLNSKYSNISPSIKERIGTYIFDEEKNTSIINDVSKKIEQCKRFFDD